MNKQQVIAKIEDLEVVKPLGMCFKGNKHYVRKNEVLALIDQLDVPRERDTSWFAADWLIPEELSEFEAPDELLDELADLIDIGTLNITKSAMVTLLELIGY